MAGITLNIANALAAARDLGAQGWAASEMLMALRIGMAEARGGTFGECGLGRAFQYWGWELAE